MSHHITGEELVCLASTHLWPDPVCLFIWLSEGNSSGKHRLFKNSLDKAVFKGIWNSPLSVNKSVLPLWLLSALSKTYKLGLRIKVRANSETHISRQLLSSITRSPSPKWKEKRLERREQEHHQGPTRHQRLVAEHPSMFRQARI